MFKCKFSLNFIVKHFSLQSKNLIFERHICSYKRSLCLQNNEFFMRSSNLFLYNRNYTPSFVIKSKLFCTKSTDIDLKSPLEIISEEIETDVLVPRSLRSPGMAHQIFLIQPIIKWGRKKNRDTSPELLIEEGEALVKTLNKWKVIDKKKLSLLSFDKNSFFNKGQLKDLEECVKNNPLISGVFVNVTSLRIDQHLFLENLFNLPVFDRYSIVISIFKQHAVTKEAKLQVALVEIPYIQSRIEGVNDSESNYFVKNTAIGSSESLRSNRFRILSDHERKIKKLIENLRKNRQLLRNKRKTLQFPIVAVVGYTNAGKTSLIKCLTDEMKMKPEDKLFATLDVTVHEGLLPCSQKVLYVDTIGFIADIPTNLLEPFVATLEDAILSDVIVHVQDLSHPNRVVQAALVLETLKSFNLSPTVMNNIITVGNKCDKVNIQNIEDDLIPVSCLKLTGLADLELRIQQGVFNALNLLKVRMRVSSGGMEYQWLQKETAIYDINVDEKDQQFVFIDVVISKANFDKFKHRFVQGR